MDKQQGAILVQQEPTQYIFIKWVGWLIIVVLLLLLLMNITKYFVIPHHIIDNSDFTHRCIHRQ